MDIIKKYIRFESNNVIRKKNTSPYESIIKHFCFFFHKWLLFTMSHHLEFVDILAIGASPSSIYLAHKIHEERHRRSMIILEPGPRIAGEVESVRIEGAPYVAEGGFGKYFEGEHLVTNLLEKYDIHTHELDTPVATDTLTTTMNVLKTVFPEDSDEISSVPNLFAIVSTSNLDASTQLRMFADSTGLCSNILPQNMRFLYGRNKAYGLNREICVEGGFTRLLDRMTCSFSRRTPIRLNTCIKSVNFCCDSQRYIINDRWATRKLLFTGSPNQLLLLPTKVHSIEQSKNLLAHVTDSTITYVKLYLSFTEPWWATNQIGVRFRSYEQSLGTMTYFSTHTIRIEADGMKAELLYQHIIEDISNANKPPMKWRSTVDMPLTTTFIKNSMLPMIRNGVETGLVPGLVEPTNVQLSSDYEIAFKYNEDALSNMQPLTKEQEDKVFNVLHNNDNFMLISGHYIVPDGGYINTAFRSVEENFSKIMFFDHHHRPHNRSIEEFGPNGPNGPCEVS